MQPHARQQMLVLTFLILGALISMPAFSRGIAGGPPRLTGIKGGTKPEGAVVMPVKPRILELKPIPSTRLERLNKEARAKYDLAMKYYDKINYEKAVEYFQQAIQLQPEDVYLRYTLIQITQYLGDTREAGDAIGYYDITIENLQAMVAAPALNAREKQRAQSALTTVVALRQSIGERETKRHTAGMEIAKQYATESFKEMDDREREQAKRKETVEQYVKQVNTAPGARTGTLQGMTSTGGFGPTATFSSPPATR